MKKLFVLLLFAFTFQMNAQTMVTQDQIEIRVKKARAVMNTTGLGARSLSVKNDRLRKVMVKTKVKSLSKDRLKLSAFSLVDPKNKIRYRLADYVGYKCTIGCYPQKLAFRKEQFYGKNGDPISNGPTYDKSEKDYFNDYDMNGFRNFEIPVNFGSKKSPKVTVIYFGETALKKLTAELYFAVFTENLELDYELYYKDEKISDIKFQLF